MPTKDEDARPRQFVGDQRAEIKPSGEARKGVNVLNTSDASNPAVNPFVPIQNQTSNQISNQGTSQLNQSSQQNNNQSKENG